MLFRKCFCPNILLLLVVLTGVVHAQKPSDYGFHKIPNVPSHKIYSLLIDKQGFIWIGDELGVSRYDGQTFTSFYNSNQSSLAMSNLAEDDYGRIWCMNFNGQVFYIEDGQMKLLEGNNSNPLVRFAIAGDKLIAKSPRGFLFTYDLRTHESKILSTIRDDMPSINISGGIQSYHNAAFFLLTTSEGLYLYQYSQDSLTRLATLPKGKYLSVIAISDHTLVLENFPDQDSFTCFTIQHHQEGEELKLTPFKTIGLEDVYPYGLSSMVDQNTWIHGRKQSIPLNDSNAKRIDGLALTSMLKDREGNTWASSLTYGLLLKKREPDWQFSPVNEETGYITSLEYWRGNILAGTAKGKLLVADTATPLKSRGVLSSGALFITDALALGNHLYVYGYLLPYVLKLDTHFNIVQRLPSFGSAHNVTAVGNNVLAFSYYRGLLAVPLSKGTQKAALPAVIRAHFSYDSTYQYYRNTHNHNRARAVCYDSTHHVLYAGFSNGLYAFDSHSVKEIRFQGNPIYTYSILQAQEQLFVSTLSSKVLILKNGRITGQLPIPKNLTESAIIKMKLFGHHLWILSAKNTYLYDLDKQSFTNINTLPPLKGIQVFDLLELNGYVYLSTSEGLYKVPLYNDKREVPPLNYLMSVVVNARDTIQNGATLAYNKNSLQFNLAALYYFNPEGVYFNYRLLGNNSSDTAWKRSPPGQREILFPYIMPGSYTFEAVAQTAQGRLSAHQKIRFTFTINKVWWQQWWFMVSMAMILSAMAYVFIRMRIKNKREANQRFIDQLRHERERLVYENMASENEMKALKSQMNPHFISNSLNAIQELFMREDKDDANEQLGNFATLTRLILTVSGKKSIPLATEIEILKKYLSLEQMRFRNSFTYEIVTDDNIDDWHIQIPPMIIQPFVENSMKHGLAHQEGAKRLWIAFKTNSTKDYLICTITDNGIGRVRAAALKKINNDQHKSFSIAAIKKRLELMSKTSGKTFDIAFKDLKDEQGQASGTSVTISIPIQAKV